MVTYFTNNNYSRNCERRLSQALETRSCELLEASIDDQTMLKVMIVDSMCRLYAKNC